jgi:hypothetical protein
MVLVKGGLCRELCHYEACRSSFKKVKASTSNASGHIEDYVI